MNDPQLWKQRFSTLFRIALAAAVIGWLLWHTGLDIILGALKTANPWLLLAAYVVMIAFSATKAWNWHQLLSGLGMRVTRQFRTVLVCYFTGGLLGAVVPSTAGTDAVRSLLAQRRIGGQMTSHIAAVVMMNAIAWMAGCTLGLFGVLLLTIEAKGRTLNLFAAPLFGAVVGGTLCTYSLLKYRRDWWLGILRWTPRRLFRVRRPLRRFADQLLIFEKAHVHFGPVFLTSLVAQVGVATVICLVGMAVGIELDFPFWLIYGPLVSTAGLIPASISGFGVEQAAYVYFMNIVGVPSGQAFVASALFSTLNLLLNVVIGGSVFVFAPTTTAEMAAVSARDDLIENH